LKTYALTCLVKSESSARQLCSLIEKVEPTPMGVGFYELDERNSIWEIEAYFKEKPKIGIIALLEGLYETNFNLSALEKVDWVSKVQRNLTPISIDNIYIHGEHHKDILALNKKNIEIQAAMAFGTGHHVTTTACIYLYLYLLKNKNKFTNVADIGCGTGILSMVAFKTCKAINTAIDNDLFAIETTRSNFSINKLSNRNIIIKSNELRNSRIYTRGKFDLIFANILFLPLKNMVKNVSKHLRPGGFIILSGMSNKQAILIEKIYLGHTFKRVKILKEGSWTSLALMYCGKYKRK